MRKISTPLLAALFVTLATAPAWAKTMSGPGNMKMSCPQMAPKTTAKSLTKGQETVVGEVIDTWCYFQLGARGAGHKACATACARNDAPMGLVDVKGNVYVLTSAVPHEGPKAFIRYMGDLVSATGTVISKGGVRLFYVNSMKPVPGAR